MEGFFIYMFSVYILYSPSRNKFYVGHTANLEDRMQRHNQGRSKATKSGIPWELKHVERFNTKSDAYRRELEIKAWKSSIRIQELINETG